MPARGCTVRYFCVILLLLNTTFLIKWLGGCIDDVWSLHAWWFYMSIMSCQVKVKIVLLNVQKCVA